MSPSNRMSLSIDSELTETWRKPPGIFVIAQVGGAAGEAIREIQLRFDPKLANALPPHVTLAGSSGVGPIDAATPPARLRELLGPICAATPPLSLPLQRPMRFMQRDIVVLPLDPHGAIRALHEQIARSGLTFGRVKFSFTPHVTLSFYRTLTPATLRALLAVVIDEPLLIDSIRCSLTDEPSPPRALLDLPLLGSPQLPMTEQSR